MGIVDRIHDCDVCPGMTCASLSCPPSGSRKSNIMIIGFNPLRGDCYHNEPLSDTDAELIDGILHDAGLNRNRVYMTYAVKGFKEDGKPGKKIANACAARFLYKEIIVVKPTKIVMLGADVFNLFFDGMKISDYTNKILVGPHYHVFAGNALSYFRRTGDTVQLDAFRRELTAFLSDDYVVDDVTPIESLNQFAVSFEKRQNDRVIPDIGFMEYTSGKEALTLAESFMVKTTVPAALDIETDRLDINLAKPMDYLLTVGLSDGKNSLSVATADLELEEMKRLFWIVLQVFAMRPVVGHHLKFDLKPFMRIMLKRCKFWQYRLYDTMLITHLVSEAEGSYKLKQLIYNKYGVDYGIDVSDAASVPTRKLREYNACDCYFTHKLLLDTWKQLTLAQQRLWKSVLSQAVFSTCFMEMCGVPFSVDASRKMIEFLTNQRDAAEQEITDLLGSAPLKPKAFTTYLANTTLNYDMLDATKQGYYTLSAENLSALASANRSKKVTKFTQAALRYLKFKKMISTYSQGRTAHIKFVDPDGRIRPSWWLGNASTGRVATTGPNILNIERTDRLPKIMQEHVESQPRNQFRVKPGRIMIKADMSQAELRVLACMSKDKALLAAYISGQDIHTVTGAKMFKTALDAVEKWQRQIAKNINFGISYGQTAVGLAATVNKAFSEQGIDRRITVREADMFIELWLEAYDGAARWMERQRELARTKGYTESAFGRRRHFVYSGQDNIDWSLDNQAVNHPIQSTSSDIVLTCQNKLLMLARHIPDFMLVKNEYDAVFSECNEEDQDELIELYKEAFTVKIGDFDGFIIVPFTHDISVGHSMADMKKVYESEAA